MSRTKVNVVPAKSVRCAIYTRKSTEDGLEQEFNSLDAQRESAEALIASQRHEGWTALPQKYDDGGFSGGSMERPGLARLMTDIEAGKVDCVVVYKVDRLSRSLMDFARIMQVFESKNVSFVSVTQQFNTTHSMGRLAARREAFGQAIGLTQKYAPVAVAALVKVLQDTTVPPAAKVTAAAVLLRFGREGIELDDLAERVDALERAMPGAVPALPAEDES